MIKPTVGTLVLEDGSKWDGISFGSELPIAGEVVFTTGMVGYPESLTDPSYRGQIIVCTYPMIGNYGVPDSSLWESNRIQASGIVVSSYIKNTNHHQSVRSLASWLQEEKIPGIEVKDTRALTQKIRHQGTMMGKILFGTDIDFYDPNIENIVAQVSVKKNCTYPVTQKANRMLHVVVVDCGVKQNIIRSLTNRGVAVTVVPWDFDVTKLTQKFHGVVLSNGPGDPKMVTQTIENVKKLLKKRIPILGICLGNQVLALAAGGNTHKLKFGHRSQNQPCKLHDGSKRFYLTTQNHSFTVSAIPDGFVEWFSNANDGSNEGIRHTEYPFMSVQFHPEARPGPTDTAWIFDHFLEQL